MSLWLGQEAIDESLQKRAGFGRFFDAKSEVVIREAGDAFDVFGIRNHAFEECEAVELRMKLRAVDWFVLEAEGLLYDTIG